MAAIAAGSIVAASAAVTASIAAAVAPKMGVVESVGGGSPPATVVVAWEDGTRDTYAVSLNVLTQILPTVTPSLLGSVVAPAVFNPGGRFSGPVVQHFIGDIAAGGNPIEVVTFRTPLGFVTLPVALVQIVPNA